MHRLLVLSALILSLCPSLLTAQSASYLSDPKFQKEVAAAAEPRQFASERLGHWKKANKIAGGTCVDCLRQIIELEYRSGDTKAEMASCEDLQRVATNPADKAFGSMMRGSALFHANRDRPKPEQLEQAEAAFRETLALSPGTRIARYMEGRTLALLHRDEDARTIFTDYVKAAPAGDRYRLRAQHFAESPALARAKMAPPFTVTTADGKQFTLDDMGGRVVLVDFWATWCGPCNVELPHMQKIAQEFAGQPFVLISVSWDKDAAKWQEFLDKHGMRWAQYRDVDHQLSEAYGVDAIPHYFTIDSDGVLQSEMIGSGSDIEGKLRKLVARAQEARPPAVGKTEGQ